MISDKDCASESAERKYESTNIFLNFHFVHANFFVYMARYHSTTTQVFIKIEKNYWAEFLTVEFISPGHYISYN